MSSISTTTVTKEGDAKNQGDQNIKFEDKNNLNENQDIDEVQEINYIFKSPNSKLLFWFNHTKLKIDLDHVNKITSSNPDFNQIFNEETMYHYCNLLFEKYKTNKLTLALFRDSNNYGPQNAGEDIDVFFHPFKWENNWHLALGFTKYKKILLVNCSGLLSNKNLTYKDYSFPLKTSLLLKDFIRFFNHKLSKYSLNYPRIFTDLYEPSTKFNGINLLTVIFSFFADPVSLTRSFCDPEFSPRKFEITDMYPIIVRLDLDFRNEYLQQLQFIRKHNDALLLETRLKEKRRKTELAKIEKEKEILRQQELKKIQQEKENAQKLKQQTELQNKAELFTERINEFKKRTAAFKENNSFKHVDSEYVTKRLRHSLRPNGSINLPIEINELEEDSGEASEYEEANTDKKSNIKNEKDINKFNHFTAEDKNSEYINLQQELLGKDQTIKHQKTELARKEHILKLENIFQQNFGLEFQKYIKNLTLFADNNKLNLMYEFIKNVSYNPLTNPELFEQESTQIGKQPFEVRDCLLVNYKRRMKQEFDEEKFSQMLEIDYKNQIIPLIFENGSIFLINIKTNDDFNCIIKLVCISNRTNRSEREIMRNYAFRRLVEMYVTKFNRLVIKIRCSINRVDSTSFYKIAMQSIYSLHHILWKNKFDLTFKASKESLENYTIFFEKIMKATEENDMFKAELNFKRLLKHVLTTVSSSDEWHPQLVTVSNNY